MPDLIGRIGNGMRSMFGMGEAQAPPPITEPAEQENSVDEFLSLARKRFRRSVEAETKNRERALKSIQFILGEQWDSSIRKRRTSRRKPCVTINLLKKFVKQVVNEIRASRPAVRVAPIGDDADVDTAKIIQGLIRHIERHSKAEVAYDTAAEYGAMGGFGFVRILTEWADQKGFDQDIVIKTIFNQFGVYGDADGETSDGSDWTYCFIPEDMSEEEYKLEYPDSDVSSLSSFSGPGDQMVWAPGGKIRVAEYFYIEKEKKKLYQLDDGVATIDVDEDGKQQIEMLAQQAGLPAPSVVMEREVEIPHVKWCKINGKEILVGNKDKTGGSDWPGSRIPVIRILGDAYVVDGELRLFGLTEDSQDSQRMVNYFASKLVEVVAIAPQAPWLAATGQTEKYATEWKQSASDPPEVLHYDPIDINGIVLPPPARNLAEPPIVALTQSLVMFAENIKGTMGLYGPSIGEPSGEKTGIAIRERKIQGNVATFHFGDNLSRAINSIGSQLVELIPLIYHRPGRVARIIGEDDTENSVVLNKEFEEEQKETGRKIKRLYQLDIGKYDVDVYMGPSFASKRQEAADAQISMAQAYPKLMEVAGDIVLKNQDWPGAPEIAERVKRTIPPEILEPPAKEGNEEEIPLHAQQQLKQLSQAVEELSNVLDQQIDIIKNKKIETESKERIESLRIQADLIKTQAELAGKREMAQVQGDLSILLKRLDQLFETEQPVAATPPSDAGTAQPTLNAGA